ncbi:11561_t:CDS:2, partial [Ambispora leptoticha]
MDGGTVDLFDYANLLHEEIHTGTPHLLRGSAIITINEELEKWLAEEAEKSETKRLSTELGKINQQLISWEKEEKELVESELNSEEVKLTTCQGEIETFQERGFLVNHWKELAAIAVRVKNNLGLLWDKYERQQLRKERGQAVAKEEEDTIARLEKELRSKDEEITRLKTELNSSFTPRRAAPLPPVAESSEVASKPSSVQTERRFKKITELEDKLAEKDETIKFLKKTVEELQLKVYNYQQINNTLQIANGELREVKESLAEQVIRTRDKNPLDEELGGYFPPMWAGATQPVKQDFKYSYSASNVVAKRNSVTARGGSKTPVPISILSDNFFSTPAPLTTTGSITEEKDIYAETFASASSERKVSKKSSAASLTMPPIVESDESELNHQATQTGSGSTAADLENKITNLNKDLDETLREVEKFRKENEELRAENTRLKGKGSVFATGGISDSIFSLTKETLAKTTRHYSSSGFLAPDGPKPEKKATLPKTPEEVFSELKAKISSLENELSNTKLELDSKQVEITKLREFIKENIEKKAEKKEEVRTKAEAAVRENNQLQNARSDLEREKNELIIHGRLQAGKIIRLEGELTNTRGKITTLELNLKNHAATLKKQTDTINNLNGKLTAAQTEVNRLSSQLNTTEAEYQKLQEQLETAETALTDTRNELKEKVRLQEESSRKILELEGRVSTLKSARNKRKAEQLKATNDFEKRLKTLEGINQELSAVNIQYKLDLAAVKKENNRYSMELRAAASQGENLTQENHKLKK